MNHYQYEGGELELFKEAKNWKKYFSSRLLPYIQGEVLEVGAGMGGTTEVFLGEGACAKHWLCLEPDSKLCSQIPLQSLRDISSLGKVDARVGTLSDLQATETFDTILYIDVLEHIEDDRGELAKAFAHLRRGGKVIVLGPAHNSLMSAFDRAVGHFRRYNVGELKSLLPDNAEVIEAGYLDSVGFFASLTNSLLLKKSVPSRTEIALWDKVLVPFSKVTDRLLREKFGKTSFLVFQKN